MDHSVPIAVLLAYIVWKLLDTLFKQRSKSPKSKRRLQHDEGVPIDCLSDTEAINRPHIITCSQETSDSSVVAESKPMSSSGPPRAPGSAIPFGYKCSWLAVRGKTSMEVASSIPLTSIREMDWKDGLEAAYAYPTSSVFITPQLGDWVLAVSGGLPGLNGRRFPDRLTPLLESLSSRLDTVVQYFGTHRVSEYHAWAWSEKGIVVRAYGYVGDAGETTSNLGEDTEAEQTLGFAFHDDAGAEVTTDPAHFDREDQAFPCEDDVMQLAELWSLDPTQLDEWPGIPGTGLCGELPSVLKD